MRRGDALFRTDACSLSDHIALHEAGLTFEHAKVDLKAKKNDSGEDFLAINPKGYVPALTLDSGETITELLWARKNGIEAPARLVALRDRMMERPAVRKAMTHEGLIKA